MKKIRLSIIAMLVLGAVACKKGDTSVNALGTVTTSDAADMVAGSLSVNSNGLASVSDDASLQSQAYVSTAVTCGSIHTDTITHSSVAGAIYAYNYSLGYTYTLSCINNIRDNVSGKVNYTGTYSGPHITSSNTGNATFTVSGLEPDSALYTFNSSYLRNGAFASKIDTTIHGNHNVDIEVKNLKLRKPLRSIAGGTATFSITGATPRRGSFSFTGTVLFNGDGTATVTVNGSAYKVNLITGDKTRI